MTRAGRAACETGTRVQQQAEQMLLGDLSPAERRQLAVPMAKLEKSAAGAIEVTPALALLVPAVAGFAAAALAATTMTAPVTAIVANGLESRRGVCSCHRLTSSSRFTTSWSLIRT